MVTLASINCFVERLSNGLLIDLQNVSDVQKEVSFEGGVLQNDGPEPHLLIEADLSPRGISQYPILELLQFGIQFLLALIDFKEGIDDEVDRVHELLVFLIVLHSFLQGEDQLSLQHVVGRPLLQSSPLSVLKFQSLVVIFNVGIDGVFDDDLLNLLQLLVHVLLRSLFFIVVLLSHRVPRGAHSFKSSYVDLVLQLFQGLSLSKGLRHSSLESLPHFPHELVRVRSLGKVFQVEEEVGLELLFGDLKSFLLP